MNTFVEGNFCAIHNAPFGAAPHGHDWFVRAEFACDGAPIHYATRQARLDECLAAIDHGDLNKLLGSNATNEGLAKWIGRRLRESGCVIVEVWRFEKNRRFGAIWRSEK